MLLTKISAFIGDSKSANFDDLALSTFQYQFSRGGWYQKYCAYLKMTPGNVPNWRDIPPIPVGACERLEFGINPAAVSALEAIVIDQTFSSAIPTILTHPAILSLIPAPESNLGSRLPAHADRLVSTFGGANSLRTTVATRLKTSEIRSWLGGSQRSGRPVVIVTSVEALRKLLDSLKRLDLRFRLPTGSTLVALDVTTALMPENSSLELIDLIEGTGQWLGVSPERIVGEYHPEKIATASYSQAGPGRGLDAYPIPHWTRVRIVDPETLEEVAPGETGLIAFLDLANIESVVHVLTEDLGTTDGETLQLVGPASAQQLSASAQLADEIVGS